MNNTDTASALTPCGPPKQSLYRILQSHIQLMQEIEDNGGDLSPEAEESLNLTLENFNEKAESIANVIRHMKGEELAIALEIDRLSERAARKQVARMRLEKRLIDASDMLGIDKVKGKYLDITFKRTEAVQITDENAIPAHLQTAKLTHTPSKKLIKAAIESGESVPGARIVNNKSLQIR